MTTEVKKEIQDGWSEDGQYYIYSGRVFGLTENLRTVYFGKVDPEKLKMPARTPARRRVIQNKRAKLQSYIKRHRVEK